MVNTYCRSNTENSVSKRFEHNVATNISRNIKNVGIY